MALRLGDLAPDFSAETTQGPIRFHEWLGDRWGVLLSHTRDFTPVCTTELAATARLKREFDRRDVRIIGLSVDPLDAHRRWSVDIRDTQGQALNFPIIADGKRAISDLYDMIHPNASDTMTVRSVFVIDPKKRIRLTTAYPITTGRNFVEILRVIDALQLTDRHGVATPANWQPGEDVIILPSMSDEEARQRFPGGFKTLKPYLRVVAQPT
jgi:alkyl hydroperoxide reductase subunit AhpC